VTAKAPAREHLPALTGIRFILAFWVILHHLTGPGAMLEPWVMSLPVPLRAIIRGGYLAVGAFFVLSGFVMARSYSPPTWNRKYVLRYAASRFARIYPIYALTLIVMVPFMIMEQIPAADKLPLVANYVLLLQGWSGKLPVNWNTPAWSLSCEFFFYLCFPVLAIFFRKLSWAGILALAATACFLPALLRSQGVKESWQPIIYLGDFLIGIATARAHDRLVANRAKPSIAGPWLYLSACAAALILIADPNLLHNTLRLQTVLRPLNALMMLGFALGGGIAARWLSSHIAILLGKASYSMYILHIPMLWWFKFCWQPFGWFPTIAGFVYIGGVIAGSVAAFRYLEEPANRRVREWLYSKV
jgi:peptidoglycan/LPS O-acetylase OafA/YrhL